MGDLHRTTSARSGGGGIRRAGSVSSVAHSVRESVKTAHDVLDDIATLMDAERDQAQGPSKPVSTAAVVFNLANTTMGVGILTLATTYEDAGLVCGPILMVLCAICTYFSVMMLIKLINICRIESRDPSGVPSIEEIAEYCLGPWGKYWIQCVLILICFGTLIAYLVSVKSLFYSGLIHLLSDSVVQDLSDHSFDQKTSMLLVMLVLCLPLSLLRRIDGLWFTSFLSVVSICYFVIISLVYYAQHPSASDRTFCDEFHRDTNGSHADEVPLGSPDVAPPSFRGLLDAFNIISVSYICQLTVVPIQKELVKGQQYGDCAVPFKKAKQQMSNATIVTMCIALVMYAGAGFSGYLTWLQMTSLPSTILACYNPDDTKITVVFFCMTAVLAFSYPLICFTCRCTIAHLIWPGETLNIYKHVGLTVAIVAPSALVAFFASKLTAVISLMSAVCTPSLCFLLPGLWYLRARQKEMEHYEKVGEDEYRLHPSYTQDAEGAAGDKSPGTDSVTRLGSHMRVTNTIPCEREHLLNVERYGTIADMTREEVDFVRAERQSLRDNVWNGYIMVAVGVFMQIACLTSTIMSFADGSA